MQQLTKEQSAIIGLFTGIACGPFRDVHDLAEELCGEPVFTHQFANKAFVAELKNLAKPMFLEICNKG